MKTSCALLRATIFSLVIGVISTAIAARTPTQAWRRIFNTGTNWEQAAGIDVDQSGNSYMAYASYPSGMAPVLHLVKVGPSSNIGFNAATPFPTADWVSLNARGVLVSPPVQGVQYVYLFAEAIDRNYFDLHTWVQKYSTAGVPQWSAPFTYTGSYDGPSASVPKLLGWSADGANNLDLAFEAYDDFHNQRYLQMITVDPSGNPLTALFASSNVIDPTTAFFFAPYDAWIAAGPDVTSTLYGAYRWGAFDRSTGHLDFGTAVAGSYDNTTGKFDRPSFTIALMPGNIIAAAENIISNPGGGTTTSISSIQFFDENGNYLGSYPRANTMNGYIVQMAGFSGSTAWYLFSNPYGTGASAPQYVEAINSLGQFLWHHANQPVDTLYPAGDGFYSLYVPSNNVVYLEHYNEESGIYDWGKTFFGTTASTYRNSYGGLKIFKDFFYVAANIYNSSTSEDIFYDRYVTGICFQSITSASTVKAGGVIPVTLHLNDLAPSGGIGVGLNSNSYKLLMPNGTRSQYFIVPAGQSSLVVNLSSQSVTANTTVSLLGISNGIRRSWAITVTP